MGFDDKLKAELARIGKGGAPKYHQKNAETGKLFARERVRLLLDADSFIEDGAFANATDPELPADGVITGLGKIGGRLVAAYGGEDRPHPGAGAEDALPDALPGRLRGRPDHRPGGDVPGTPGCGADFLPAVPDERPGAAD